MFKRLNKISQYAESFDFTKGSIRKGQGKWKRILV